MQQVFSLISQAAPSRSTILVVGRERHRQGAGGQGHPRQQRRARTSRSSWSTPGSLPHDLLESNLFGHVKGAFTGAVYAKKGLFELADKGTLFFDEIGNIPLETQAKLLRVMQEREFMRLGGVGHGQGGRAHRGRHQHRPAARGGGRAASARTSSTGSTSSRSSCPPLRQRKEDIPALVAHFVDKYARENDKPVAGVTPGGAAGPAWTTTGRATCASWRT